MSERTIAIRIDENLHREIKIRLAETDMTLKDYIINLIKNDLNEDASVKLKAIPENHSVDEKTVQEAQKVLDFVSDILRCNEKK